MPLSRYEETIPDHEGFLRALATPLEAYLRANPRRLDGPALAARLEAAGARASLVPGIPGAVRVEGLERPGATLEWALGYYHMQGVTSMVPVLALDPQPGERVLDLCAAPGSKTGQLCERVGDEGFVVANEPYLDRIAILKMHLERLGHVNAVLTQVPGESFPGGLRFDRVLVDAPCSGEGTERTRPDEGIEALFARLALDRQARAHEIERMWKVQRKLLRRAANLVRPGGVLVYSTCTFAPEENECCLDAILRERADLEPEPFDDPLGGEPGLTSWEGRALDPRLAHARRYYPHQSGGSWGFFVARLRRRADAVARPMTPLPPPPDEAEEAGHRARAFAALARFGVAEEALARAGRTIVRFGRAFWIVSQAMPHPAVLARYRPQNPGIRLFRDDGRMWKPSSYAAIWLGDALRENTVDLDPSEVPAFVRGEPIARHFPELTEARGYAVARVGGAVLGLGLLRAGALCGELPARLAGIIARSLWIAPAALFRPLAPGQAGVAPGGEVG